MVLFFKHHAIKAFGRVEVQLYALLVSVLGGGKWTSFVPAALTLDLRLLNSCNEEVVERSCHCAVCAICYYASGARK